MPKPIQRANIPTLIKLIGASMHDFSCIIDYISEPIMQ